MISNVFLYKKFIRIYKSKQACNQGAFAPPPKFSKHCIGIFTFAEIFKNKDEILYSKEVLLEFFFILLVNYLLTRFILRQVIRSKIS